MRNNWYSPIRNIALLTSLCLILLLSTVASAKIVFDSKRDGVTGIYVMDDNGNNVTLLTDTLVPRAPRWSPDGKQIVFERQVIQQDSQRSHLFMMNADGTNVRQLTPPHWGGTDVHPSFLPDGKSILFRRYTFKGNKHSINVLSLESGAVRQISDLGANKPEWAPEGRQIICSSLPIAGGSGGNIWIMNADGSNARELLPPLPKGKLIISRWNPRWSPDGKRILYMEDQDTLAQIGNVLHYIPQAYRYLIFYRHSKQIRALKIPKNLRPQSIAWMNNGNAVLFSATERKLKQPVLDDTKSVYNIYKYHIATGKITQLTNHPEQDLLLDWVNDNAHSVSPSGKLATQWGELKTFEREQQ